MPRPEQSINVAAGVVAKLAKIGFEVLILATSDEYYCESICWGDKEKVHI